jgi:hypothetical protein
VEDISIQDLPKWILGQRKPGETKRAFAFRIGVCEESLVGWEGGCLPRLQSFIDICHCCGYEVWYVLKNGQDTTVTNNAIEFLVRVMAEKGISQYSLAKHRIHSSNISIWRMGKNLPMPKTLEHWAELLGYALYIRVEKSEPPTAGTADDSKKIKNTPKL